MRPRIAGAGLARRAVAVADRAARRRDERGEHADQRGLAGAVRAEQAEDLAARDASSETRDTRAPPAEMARDVGQLDAVEVEGSRARASGAARPARGLGVVGVERAVDLLERARAAPRGAPAYRAASPRPLPVVVSRAARGPETASRAARPAASARPRRADRRPPDAPPRRRRARSPTAQRQARSSAARALWCGRPRDRQRHRLPRRRSLPPAAAMIRRRRPSGISCCRSICGDASRMSPTFFTMTPSCSKRRRKRLLDLDRRRTSTGSAHATCTSVSPGGNGPSTANARAARRSPAATIPRARSCPARRSACRTRTASADSPASRAVLTMSSR